jgi:hypothetical protein
MRDARGIHPPLAFAGDPLLCLFRIGLIVGCDELDVQGDRVLVVGVAAGKIKATNKPFKDNWVFDITVRDGKVTNIREYIDTQALARASQRDASGLA